MFRESILSFYTFPLRDHFHEPRVAQHGLDGELMALVSDPVSAEDALHRQNHVAAVWLDRFYQII